MPDSPTLPCRNPNGWNLPLVARWAGFLVMAGLVAFFAVFHVRNKARDSVEEMRGDILQHARKIHAALVNFAASHDGNFPAQRLDGGPLTNSNEAFRTLFAQDAFKDEYLFYIPGSNWCKATPPDGVTGDASTQFSDALAPGENGFSYVSGLNTKTSSAAAPVAMEAGLFMDRFNVVVRVGGDVRLLECDESGQITEERDGRQQNLFGPAFGIDAAQILTPAR